jgi:hypothetical protein
MKVQEVQSWSMGGQISWVQAGEILGLCPRQVLRLRKRFGDDGYAGLFDRRRLLAPRGDALARWECRGAQAPLGNLFEIYTFPPRLISEDRTCHVLL